MSVIEDIETQIVGKLLASVSTLQPLNGGTVKGVGEPSTFFTNAAAYTPPAAFVVFDGEKADENRSVGRAFQPTFLYWSVFLVCKSFGAVNEGRTNAYALIDDVIDALQGFPLSVQSSLFYIGAEIVDVKPLYVVYQVTFRCNSIRQQPAA